MLLIQLDSLFTVLDCPLDLLKLGQLLLITYLPLSIGGVKGMRDRVASDRVKDTLV